MTDCPSCHATSVRPHTDYCQSPNRGGPNVTTADDVIDSIDHALHDLTLTPDAMRWTPEPASPLAHTQIAMGSMAARMLAASEQFRAAMARFAEAINATAPRIAQLLEQLEAEKRAARGRAIRTAYRARTRRRTRSRR